MLLSSRVRVRIRYGVWQWRIQKFWKGGGRQFISSVLIIANAHNEIYAFYTKRSGFLEKKIWANRGESGRPHRPPPFESATGLVDISGYAPRIYILLLFVIVATLPERARRPRYSLLDAVSRCSAIVVSGAAVAPSDRGRGITESARDAQGAARWSGAVVSSPRPQLVACRQASVDGGPAALPRHRGGRVVIARALGTVKRIRRVDKRNNRKLPSASWRDVPCRFDPSVLRCLHRRISFHKFWGRVRPFPQQFPFVRFLPISSPFRPVPRVPHPANFSSHTFPGIPSFL